jgi:hypothetical protein
MVLIGIPLPPHGQMPSFALQYALWGILPGKIASPLSFLPVAVRNDGQWQPKQAHETHLLLSVLRAFFVFFVVKNRKLPITASTSNKLFDIPLCSRNNLRKNILYIPKKFKFHGMLQSFTTHPQFQRC